MKKISKKEKKVNSGPDHCNPGPVPTLGFGSQQLASYSVRAPRIKSALAIAGLQQRLIKMMLRFFFCSRWRRHQLPPTKLCA